MFMFMYMSVVNCVLAGAEVAQKQVQERAAADTERSRRA